MSVASKSNCCSRATTKSSQATHMVQNFAAYFQVLDRKGTCVFTGCGGEVYA